MSQRLHSLTELSSLFGEPDASARATKKDAQAEAQARPESRVMLDIAQVADPHYEVASESPQPRLLFSVAQQSEVRRIKALLSDRLKQAARLPADDLIAETATITPAMAEYILQHHNRDNRGLRRKHVDRFVKIIRDGDWKVTSQGISFARTGRLNDGQHRLSAIVRAGCPVTIKVTFGEAEDAFMVLDTHAVRGGSDTLHVAGFKNTTSLAAAARLLAIIETGNPLLNLTIGNAAILDLLEKHPELPESTVPGKRVSQKLKCSVAGATVAFYLISQHSPRSSKLTEFADRLYDNALQGSRSPITALRDGLMQKTIDAHFRSAGNRGVAQAAAIIKAWNAWVSNRKNSSVRWEASETFPLPV
jgi:hypothetical protein